MQQPPYPPYPPRPPHPPPESTPRFLRFGIGGAIVIVLFSVGGTFLRIYVAKADKTDQAKREAMPAVGSEGTLAHAPPGEARLCPVRNAWSLGFPCGDNAVRVAPSSRVRVMKADVRAREAICRYWVQGGPQDNASGDAPCEWFVAQ